MQANPSIAAPVEQPASPMVCSTCGREFVPASKQSKKFCITCRWRAWKDANPIRACKPAVKSQIVRLYKQGLSVRKVAKLVHLDVMFVADVITKAGCMRANGEARRGRSAPKSADKWRMVAGRIEGKSAEEIAKELHLASPSNINRALRSMGWRFTGKPGHNVCHSFGEVFDRNALRRLYEMSPFVSVSEMAQNLEMPSPTLAPQLSTTRIPGQELGFDTALKIRRWWEDLFFWLMSKAPANPTASDRPGKSSIVLKFFPNLRGRYLLLVKVLRRLAPTLHDKLEWSRHDLEQHLCKQAKLEKAGKIPGDLFIQFLPWAPVLMPFLAKKLQALRAGQKIALIAREIIAGSLNTEATMIWTVISGANRIRPISGRDMGKLIFQYRAARAAAQPQPPQSEASKGGKGGRGRQKGAILEKTKPKITLAAYYSSKGMKPYAIAPYVFPASNADEMENSRRAIRGLFKDHRSEIEAAKARLSALSEVELEAEIGSATQEVMREAERKRDNKRGKPLAA